MEIFWNILFWIARQFNKLNKLKWWKKKYKVHFRTTRKTKRENLRYIDDMMKNIFDGKYRDKITELRNEKHQH